jgi:hypothetical protein
MTLIDYIKGLNLKEREVLGHMGGTTGAYITSMIYRKAETTSLAVAVAIDKHSQGKLDFRTLMNRSEDIDWDYIKQALNTRNKVVFVENADAK